MITSPPVGICAGRKANTAMKRILTSIRRLFAGKKYTATLCINGMGIYHCTIEAPNQRRAMEEAVAIADPGFVVSCVKAAA